MQFIDSTKPYVVGQLNIARDSIPGLNYDYGVLEVTKHQVESHTGPLFTLIRVV